MKVTFNIPKEAAEKLARLAEQGDEVLRELGILSIQVEGGRVSYLSIFFRVADPVPFWPDPDPANQNFKKLDPDPTCSYQEAIQTSNFFSSHQTYFF